MYKRATLAMLSICILQSEVITVANKATVIGSGMYAGVCVAMSAFTEDVHSVLLDKNKILCILLFFNFIVSVYIAVNRKFLNLQPKGYNVHRKIMSC
jgi:hypothetical protein